VIRRILFSPNEPRFRAGWRILAHFGMMFGAAIVLTVGVIIVHLLGVQNLTSLLVNQLALFVAINLSVPFARWLLDQRSFVSLGFGRQHALPDVLAGIVIAGLIMGAIFLAEWRLGWLSVEAVSWPLDPDGLSELGVWFLIFVIVGWQEELLARGYWLQNIAEGLNLPLGVLLSSAMFALMHISNPSVSWIAIMGLFFAGLFLASGYLFTRQLWLPIGLHIGWNFFEGNVFGFQVSGLETFRLIHVAVNGPEWWTGGAFGPEAGLIVLPAMALGVALMWGYVRVTRLIDDSDLSGLNKT
jgi:hypothetical protein